jgi:hypothetical protein
LVQIIKLELIRGPSELAEKAELSHREEVNFNVKAL